MQCVLSDRQRYKNKVRVVGCPGLCLCFVVFCWYAGQQRYSNMKEDQVLN
jgi:hypothetical protein